MFRNIKVGTRLILGFGLAIGFMAAIVGVGLHQARITDEKLAHIVNVNNVRIKLANNMIDAARETAISVRDIIIARYITTDNKRASEYKTKLAERRAAYAEALAAIEKLVTPDDTKGLLLFSKLKATEADAARLQDQVIERATAGKPAEAAALMTGKAYPAVKQWISEADDFIHHTEARSDIRFHEIGQTMNFTRTVMLSLGAGAVALSVLIVIFLSLGITGPLNFVVNAANRIASGDLDVDLSAAEKRGDELGVLVQSFSAMAAKLRDNRDSAERADWLKSGIARLNQAMVGDPDPAALAAKVISEISTYIGAQVGAVYLAQDGDSAALSLMGSYAYSKHKNLPDVFKPGEGLVGQAALEKKQILIKNAPEDYIKVTSGLGQRVPRFICVSPFIYEGRVKGVIEVGTLNELTDRHLEYLDQAMPAIALAVESAESRLKLAQSLEESQTQAEELQAQQEELKTANEELGSQAQALKASEEELKTQQEELEVTNEELEEKNKLLDRQNRDVETARNEIEEKAADLALVSKYKSEFLANMSHELRTPLNSLLLLAQSLSENKAGNLTEDQVESAKIIYGGGSDLLSLINEILDLSKIEAGRMDLQRGTVLISGLAEGAHASFGHMAEAKGLKLAIEVRGGAPAEIVSDRKRVEQVIRNLVSNAIKFTDSGSVTLSFLRPAPGTDLSKSGLSVGECLAIEVRDTGIGIDQSNQKRIFEAFQQVDGGTARKYGGTGLGLSISRELSRLLGGEIKVNSEPGKGSAFTLYLPLTAPYSPKAATGDIATVAASAGGGRADKVARQIPAAAQAADDRGDLKKGDKVMLVIEDDPIFAGVLYGKCRARGFKCLLALTGEAGLELAGRYLPAAVILDIHLPGMDGWDVLNALKENINTRHIPVHVVSAEETSSEAVRRGAVGHAVKPLSQKDLEDTFRRFEHAWAGKTKRVLVVENVAEMRAKILELIGGGDVQVDGVETGARALEALRAGGYDCVVLDIGLPDIDGMELLRKLETEGVALPPVIIHTARELTREEETAFRERAEAIVIKDVRSQERLLDEVSMFLHRVVGEMPEKQSRIIRDLHSADQLLKGKKVLIVDDDMRTTFAMSRLLTEHGIKTLKAEDGEKGLRLLAENPDTDLVLMDIMMPVMDGYEAMKRIRAQEKFRKLPIIVLTAKAMREDREKCLAAGANDYLPKPVDKDRLFSMMRVWLCR
ncbi:MAG: response regulator [Elusimicrobiota bacterium]|nr:response regulator [Elusimicrobiota bacterium]